jgi:hypothetical protein
MGASMTEIFPIHCADFAPFAASVEAAGAVDISSGTD